MIIGLDYDGTYTRDPELWDQFIEMFQAKGHTIIIATMRHEGESIDHIFKDKCEIVYTRRLAKKVFLDNKNIKPDIWVDDNPMWIYTDAT